MKPAQFYRTVLERHPDWEMTLTRKCHCRWRHIPSGAVVYSASTPSDHRATRNLEAMMNRVERGGTP